MTIAISGLYHGSLPSGPDRHGLREGRSETCLECAIQHESADGPRCCEALRGAAAIRERARWRPVATAEKVDADDGRLRLVALYSGGKYRAASRTERERGIPEGWIGR